MAHTTTVHVPGPDRGSSPSSSRAWARAADDGLAGAADTGPLGDQNGFVEIEELKHFIDFQVLEKSMGRQRATVPKVISGENFLLARVGGGR